MREAKAANLAESRGCKHVVIDRSARACLNCQYYEQYWRQNRGNTMGWTPTECGYCLLKECGRGALRQPCKDFLPHRPK